MEYVNGMRGVLVAGAALTAIGAAFAGEWLVTLILLGGVAAHGWLWWYLYRGPGATSKGGQPQPTRPRGNEGHR